MLPPGHSSRRPKNQNRLCFVVRCLMRYGIMFEINVIFSNIGVFFTVLTIYTSASRVPPTTLIDFALPRKGVPSTKAVRPEYTKFFRLAAIRRAKNKWIHFVRRPVNGRFQPSAGQRPFFCIHAYGPKTIWHQYAKLWFGVRGKSR